MVAVVGLGLGYIGFEFTAPPKAAIKENKTVYTIKPSGLDPKEVPDLLAEPQGEVTERVFFDVSGELSLSCCIL